MIHPCVVRCDSDSARPLRMAPVWAGNYSLEAGETVWHITCKCCVRKKNRVIGFVRKDSRGHAKYYALLNVEEERPRVGLTISVGPWSDLSARSERTLPWTPSCRDVRGHISTSGLYMAEHTWTFVSPIPLPIDKLRQNYPCHAKSLVKQQGKGDAATRLKRCLRSNAGEVNALGLSRCYF